MRTEGRATLPYEAFYAPLLARARKRLAREAGTALSRLAPAALATCERALLTRLSRLGFLALDFECSLWRGEIQLAALLGDPAGTTAASPLADDPERAFIAHITQPPAESPLDKYPVLAHLLSRITDFWVASTAELCRRLANDRTAIERAFGSLADRVIAVDCHLSDPHLGSRFVTGLAFESGLRLIYKPRPVGLEAAYYGLIAWMNARSDACPLRIVTTLERGEYGWMEYVEPRACADETEAREYFRRAGVHLCLLYVLGGSDLHAENLIAAGPDPLPIDLEVLMRPSLAGREVANAASWQRTAWELEQSVLSTGLLPAWLPVAGGRAVNLGGLGGPASDAPSASSASSRNDAFQRAARQIPDVAANAASRRNRPTLSGRPLDIVDYRGDLVDGFVWAYDVVADHANDLLGADGPLARFRGQRLRYIHRPTTVYVKGIQKSLDLDAFESANVRTAALEPFLVTARTSVDQAEALDRIGRAEIAAMAQLDIPYFRGSVDSCDLSLPDETTIADYFTRSGFECCEERIRGLCPADRARQRALIEGTLSTVGLRAHGGAIARRSAAAPPHGQATPGELLEESHAIARHLRDSAIRIAGGVTWLGPQLMPHSDRFHFSPLGPSLYDGSTGVALFLAAVAHATGERPWHDLAMSSLAPLLTALSEPGLPRAFARSGGGLGIGWGGVLYGVIRCARLLDSTECHEAAMSLLDRFARSFTAVDRRADVMFGDAGAIFGVVALYEETGDPRALDLATALGHRLAGQREPADGGLRSWKSGGGFPSGFSHGVAGCAGALARLSRHARLPEFRAAIEDALAFEDQAPPVPMCAWCHGTPGVLLARLECHGVDESLSGRAPIDRAIVELTTTATAPIDQCCCGNAGRLDILHVAAERLDQPALRDRALGMAAGMIAAARERGCYACIGEHGAVQSPGLFQGLSGVGYTLLRLAQPRGLPSFLGAYTA